MRIYFESLLQLMDGQKPIINRKNAFNDTIRFQKLALMPSPLALARMDGIQIMKAYLYQRQLWRPKCMP